MTANVISKQFTVIGGGSIGRRHVANLMAYGVPPTHITVVDLSADALDLVPAGPARRLCSVETPVREAIDGDVLFICTPAPSHEKFVGWAISQRRPFFVEKPATMKPDSWVDWHTDVPHLVGCNMRFRADVVQFRRLAKLAGAGHVASFTSWQDMTRWPGRGYVGELWEFIHEIDLAVWCFGEARVSAAARVRTSCPDRYKWSVNLTHASGVHSSIAIGHDVASVRSANLIGPTPAAYAWTSDDWAAPAVNQMYLNELGHFFAVLDGARSRCTLADARHAIRLCHDAELAAGVGVTVEP